MFSRKPLINGVYKPTNKKHVVFYVGIIVISPNKCYRLAYHVLPTSHGNWSLCDFGWFIE